MKKQMVVIIIFSYYFHVWTIYRLSMSEENHWNEVVLTYKWCVVYISEILVRDDSGL